MAKGSGDEGDFLFSPKNVHGQCAKIKAVPTHLVLAVAKDELDGIIVYSASIISIHASDTDMLKDFAGGRFRVGVRGLLIL